MAKYPKVPGLKYGGTPKRGAPARPQVEAAGPVIEQQEPSWGHGVDTQKYGTEQELDGDRY